MSLHNPISPLRALYVQKVLPAVYDDSLSYYEVLAKTQEKLNEVISDTNDVSSLVLELQQAMDDFIHGGYTDTFEEYLDEWFAENADEFVQRLVDEGIIPEVEDLQSDIESMHGDIADLVASDASIRSDMVAADASIRNDMTAADAELHAEDTSIRSDMVAADTAIRNDMVVADTAIRSDMDAADLELTDTKVPYPVVGATPSYGTSGQVLTTNADGTTEWQDPIVPSDAQAEQVITQWLDAHPEATTTVQDGSITTAKLANGAVTSDKLSDGSVTNDKLSEGYISKQEGIMSDAQTANLIVADAVRYGEYYDANGRIESSASWWRTPLIPSLPSTSYSAGSCRTLFFDSSGTYISDNASWQGVTFTTPANTAYIATCSNQPYTSAYLYLSTNVPSSWVKGERLITTSKVKDFEKDAADAVLNSNAFEKSATDAVLNSNAVVPISVGTQLFDKDGVYSDITTGEYIAYDTGAHEIVPTLEWFPLDVSAGENYVCSGDANKLHVAFFSSLPVGRAHYISGVLAESGVYFTVPSGATIMTISVRISTAAQLMVQRGTTATPYEPYQRGITTNYYFNKSVTLEKLGTDVLEALEALEPKPTVTIGSSNCDYTNICTAIKENQSNTIFVLAPETFDVQAAYEAEYGSGFFTNYTRYSQHPSDPMYRGLNLGIGCELHGQPNTELQFMYSGDNADVAQFFSVLSLTDNNIVNGVRIKINGHCRYAVHDDYSTIVGATSIIEHCVFMGTTSDSGRPYIGTGMGRASSYIYRNCVFDGTGTRAIGLHNCEQSALGRVEIYGCYCGQAIYIFHYGVSTAKSPVMIHDCKASGIYLTWAAQQAYPNENMELYAWNNITNN